MTNEERIKKAVKKLQEIVETSGVDEGVIYLSNDSTAHWDEENGCNVYDNESFSPLGDALIELYKILTEY